MKKYVCFLCALLCFACYREDFQDMKREDLFSLFYGSFEDDINLSNIYKIPSNSVDSQIVMKKGFFYISNPGAKKILKLTSFGDLLAVYYNGEYSRIPDFRNQENTNVLSTREAIEYPFNFPTFIVVTDNKNVYIVDGLTEDRIEYDLQDNIGLKNIVLHFDEKGEFVDYIGQEGYGGSPFPSIDAIYSNNQDEIIVVCKVNQNVRFYYYNSKGGLVHKYSISLETLPEVYKEKREVYMNIDRTIPINDFLYVKVDYYIQEIDHVSNVKKGIIYDKTMLHTFNRKTKTYIKSVELPFYEDNEIRNGDVIKTKRIYEFIGMTEDGKCFLITPKNEIFALAIFDTKDNRTYKHNLIVPLKTIYSNFYVSNDGMLCALFADENEVKVSMWLSNMLTRKNYAR
ncbi:MAG: LIC_12708 family protein [Treponema sp.]